MTSLRLVAGLLIVGLLASCSVEANRSHVVLDGDALAAERAAYDEQHYCAVLDEALLMTPQGAATSADMAAFADALDDAAEYAKLEHRGTLRAIADINRNPAESTPAQAFSAMNRSIPIYRFASEQCGISAPGVTVHDDGSVSFSSSFSASSSISIEGSTSGDSDDSAPVLAVGPGSASALDVTGSVTERLDRLNASLGAETGLVFETVTVETDEDGGYDVLAAIPAGWIIEPAGVFGVEASNGDAFSDFVVSFDSNCQGICTPQTWDREVMQDPQLSPFALWGWDEVELLVLQELESPAGRLMVVEHDRELFGRKIEVVLVRWDDNADQFFECSVQLSEDVAGLWPQFAQACALAEPVWFS